MKLASLKHRRDGELLVVSRDLTRATRVPDLASTLQAALDSWQEISPKLQAVSDALNDSGMSKNTHVSVEGSQLEVFAFDPRACASPLPRAYQWADGSAYVNHVELVRKARGAEVPDSFWHDPLMYQGGSDSFIGPQDDILIEDEAWGIDFEAEIAVITDDVAMGSKPEQCAEKIRLLMLVNDVSLRALIPAELSKGFGFFQSKPSSAFSPVAITPDELGDAWQDGRVNLPMLVDYNEQSFGKANAKEDMTFNFPQLVAHAVKSRPLCAGAIIGSGTVSNKQNTDHGSSIAGGGVGYSCIAELRMIETINHGKAVTPFMSFGDSVRIDMKDAQGESIFGVIEQRVKQYNPNF